MKVYYHFTGNKLRDGRDIPPVGKWLAHDGEIKMCYSGLHASPTAFQALEYAPGEILHKVYLRGELQEDSNKIVGRERRIIATIDASNILRHFARKVALDVAHLWDPPQLLIDYLKTGDESTRIAARDAARTATWASAQTAAQDIVWTAAQTAARGAARAAAWGAAGAAAGAAAGDAARGATWAAAWTAAGAAAGDAARWRWTAAQDAAWAKYGAMLNEMVDVGFAKCSKNDN